MSTETTRHHHKDAEPAATVARIGSLLGRVGIKLREVAWFEGVGDMRSLCVAPERLAEGYPPTTTNGKGMDADLARASAYAEFMERLQNSTRQTPVLLGASFDRMPCQLDDPPDAVSRSVGELATRGTAALAELLRPWDIDAEEARRRRLICFPFYNVMTGAVEELPANLLFRACTSNGMAAGNSPAEAIQQGLCEVLERFVAKRAYRERLRLPTIPLAALDELPISHLIEELTAQGLRVIVKDGSLGGKLPVVAVIVHDPTGGRYQLRFAGDPVLDVAVQRCLTEALQGVAFARFASQRMLPLRWDEEADPRLQDRPPFAFDRFVRDGDARFVTSIFLSQGEPRHREAFRRGLASNSERLEHLVSALGEQGYQVLVRDTSYLGFPSYCVYVPRMSEIWQDETAPRTPLPSEGPWPRRRFLLGLADRSVEEIRSWLPGAEEEISVVTTGEVEQPDLFSLVVDAECGVRRLCSAEVLLAELACRVGDYARAFGHLSRHVDVVTHDRALELDRPDYTACLLACLKHKADGIAEPELAHTLEDLYGAALAAEVLAHLPSPSQPLSRCILPRCGDCARCGLQGHCFYPAYSETVTALNRAMAESRIDQSRLAELLPAPGAPRQPPPGVNERQCRPAGGPEPGPVSVEPAEPGRPTVALVSMPFHGCLSPPMALGLLKAILARAGIPATIYNFNLDFLALALPVPSSAEDRELDFAQMPLPASGEWVFRPRETPEQERRSAEELARALDPSEDIAPLLAMRAKVDRFVERCAAALLQGGHDILCFGASFMQTRAALRVAEAVRQNVPQVRIVFGGASAFGVKGRALIEAFPVVDVVCHGEADLTIESLIRALRGEPGHDLERVPGISFRGPAGLTFGDDVDIPPADLDELPPPDHTEWIRQVNALREAKVLPRDAHLSLSVETARGCWWATRHQCSFCALAWSGFRSKSPARVVQELDTLADRHGLRSYYFVDDNLAPGYFETVLPALAERRYAILWNVKPNLTRGQMALLARAGVQGVVVGIESLLTPTLALLSKGSTGIQNLQALKWFAEHGVRPLWNYLSNVPGERVEWLQKLARLLPRVMHLTPPCPGRIFVERGSPYHRQPERHGIELRGAHVQSRLAFPEVAPALLDRLVHGFDYAIPGRDPAVDECFAATLWPLLVEWRARFARDGCTLSIVHGPAESLLVEGPFWKPERLWRVRGALRAVLLACEGVRSERSLAARLAPVEAIPPAPADLYEQLLGALARGSRLEPQVRSGGETLAETLAAAEAAGLVVREGRRWLALPVNRTPYVQTPGGQRRIALLRLRELFVAARASEPRP